MPRKVLKKWLLKAFSKHAAGLPKAFKCLSKTFKRF
jgi:hypothetical protein